jgi:hypothetical protein
MTLLPSNGLSNWIVCSAHFLPHLSIVNSKLFKINLLQISWDIRRRLQTGTIRNSSPADRLALFSMTQAKNG